jgi:hypothetical protein
MVPVGEASRTGSLGKKGDVRPGPGRARGRVLGFVWKMPNQAVCGWVPEPAPDQVHQGRREPGWTFRMGLAVAAGVLGVAGLDRARAGVSQSYQHGLPVCCPYQIGILTCRFGVDMSFNTLAEVSTVPHLGIVSSFRSHR